MAAEVVAAVDVAAAEEELVEHLAVLDPVEVVKEAVVVAEEVVAMVEHPDLLLFEEMPTDLGIMTCMTVPVEEVSHRLNHQLN